MTEPETIKACEPFMVASMLRTSTNSCGILPDTQEEGPWWFNCNASTSLSSVIDVLGFLDEREANLTKPRRQTVSHCLFADTAVSLFMLQMSVRVTKRCLQPFSKFSLATKWRLDLWNTLIFGQWWMVICIFLLLKSGRTSGKTSCTLLLWVVVM